MPIHNADIASQFNEIANLLEINGENPFRIRAYRNAARTVSGVNVDFKKLIDSGKKIPKLQGIGEDLANKIAEISATGHCDTLEELRKKSPPSLSELLSVPGLGPKRIQALHRELGITSISQLNRAARAGQLRDLPGFGILTEQHILDAIVNRTALSARFKRPMVEQVAKDMVNCFQSVPGVDKVVVAGSYRRLKESVGDLDILVTAATGSSGSLMATLIDKLSAGDDLQSVLSKGETRSSVLLRNGLQVDIRLVLSEDLGAALHYFTGSKLHNIAIRRLARSAGLKINEYGVFSGRHRIAGDTEESIFASVHLPFIVPELREDRGEIQAARAGKLPKLITLNDLRGDLHVHTSASDGHQTIEEMAHAAYEKNLGYIAITDHSQRLTVAHGLSPQQLALQGEEIDRINRSAKITILKGCEVDILEDGSLDYPDSVLKSLDVVVAAIHSKFDLPRERQTERVLRALENPYVSILAHPTTRLIGERKPIEIDMPQIMRKAKNRHICLELNSQPERLDLDDTFCLMARDEGILVSINSDSHSTLDFANLRYGVDQARRGWLECQHVLNTRSVKMMLELLCKSRSDNA